MILEFSVSNYRSFQSEQTLSLLPSGEGNGEAPDHMAQIGKWQVLKAALIYGANASGKSNLMKALQSLRTLVLFGGEKHTW
jgi:AAA15 family ATPase/GTPase